MKIQSWLAPLLAAAVFIYEPAFAAVISTSSDPADKALAKALDPVLAQAKDRTVRIMMGGTSIATFAWASNQLLVSQLTSIYGDARSIVLRAGMLDGSWDLPVQKWYKQPYSGPSFVRICGNSTSQPLDIEGYGSRIVIEYSKEANGGSSQVLIDGVVVGAINCFGAQEYSVKAVYQVPEGMHRVTFQRPGGGFAYLERVTFEQDRPGIQVIDGTLGGSGLVDVYGVYPRGGQTVAGVPTQPRAGVRSYFGRPDIDLVIWSGPVNDFGGSESDFTTWSTRMNEVVETMRGRSATILRNTAGSFSSFRTAGPHGLKTGDTVTISGVEGSDPPVNGTYVATITSPITFTVPVTVRVGGAGGQVMKRGCPLLLIAEMGGHFAMPSDPNHADFQQKYEYLLKLGRENAHVFTVDWHGATVSQDIAAYAASYYSQSGPVVVDPSTGDYTGDFIHPNAAAGRIGLNLICQSLDIPVPPEAMQVDVDNRIRRTSPVPKGTSIMFYDGAVRRSGLASDYGASVFSAYWSIATLPLIFSPETTNLSNWNQQIAASPTSDRFGKYIEYPQDLPLYIFNQDLEGQRVTITALMKPHSTSDWLRIMSPGLSPGTMYYKNAVLEEWFAKFYDRNEPPLWITFEYVPGAQKEVYFNGKLYSLSVTRTNGQPVSTEVRNFPVTAEVRTEPTTYVTQTGATLNATVRSGGNGALSVSFDFGTDESLPGLSGGVLVPDDGKMTRVEQTLIGLKPATTYYYRVGVTSAGNPVRAMGETFSFRTPAVRMSSSASSR